MNDVVAEEHRDAQARLLHSLTLHDIAQFRLRVEVYQRTDFRRDVLHFLAHVVGIVVASQRVLVELHYLLFRSHTAEKVLHASLYGCVCVLIHSRDLVFLVLLRFRGAFIVGCVGVDADGKSRQKTDNR